LASNKNGALLGGLSQEDQAKQWVSLMFNPYFYTQYFDGVLT